MPSPEAALGPDYERLVQFTQAIRPLAGAQLHRLGAPELLDAVDRYGVAQPVASERSAARGIRSTFLTDR
jgi:hypothetical protein